MMVSGRVCVMNACSPIVLATLGSHVVTGRLPHSSWRGLRASRSLPAHVDMDGFSYWREHRAEEWEHEMKIVVIGGSGLIGSKLVNKLRQHGHEAVAAAPDTGVNTLTGEGLAEAL